jgi:hypothetical protein
MKKGILITFVAVFCFLLGGFVGMNVASLYWKNLVEDGVLGQASFQITHALVPMKQLHDGKTDAAMASLQRDVESGLTFYDLHRTAFRRTEPVPDLLVKAKALLEETRKGTNGPNQPSQPIAGKPGSG